MVISCFSARESSLGAAYRATLMKRWGYSEPAIEQTLLVRQVEKECSVIPPVHIARFPDETQANTITKGKEALLALGTTPDKDLARAIICHELAHAHYDDPRLNLQIESGELDLEEILNSPEITNIRDAIKRYTISALTALDNSSSASRVIKKIIKQKDPKQLLKSIDDLGDADSEMDLYEIEEHRADLFAANHLTQHNHFASLVALIIDLVQTELGGFMSDAASTMALTSDMFFIRRVLVIIGYLVEQKNDVNRLLLESEKQGQCHDLYQLDDDGKRAIFTSPEAS